MDAKIFLSDYSKKIEVFARKFFAQELARAAKINPVAIEAVKILQVYMQGGKKVRCALTSLGYQLATFASPGLANVIPAAFAVELMHNALVIHDDFVDHDNLRRGKPTVHTLYGRKHGEHYGASMALVVGDVAIFQANRLLAGLSLPHERVLVATCRLNERLLNTGYGELMDIDFDFKKNITWEDIVRVRIYKTAHYTFVMPLLVGATLGGAAKKLLGCLEKYGEPVGLAFQIHDDILGIFGDSQVTGKSTDSDIREGKKTLLYFQALELARGEDKQFLKRWYGQKQIGSLQLKKIKKIIQDSGALEYSQNLAREYVTRAKKYIPKITSSPDLAQTLASLADYMVERER